MTIIRLTDKTRKLPIRAIIRRKGHPTLMQHFLTKAEAKQWEGERLREIRLTGMPLTIDALKRQTVKQIVERYLIEVTPSKGCRVSETLVLKKFLRDDPMAAKSLAYVTKQDGHAYISRRQKETWRGKTITARTVKREVGSLHNIFEVAREQWGLTNLNNPFRDIPIKGSKRRRRRRLKEGEMTKLEEACKKCLGLNRLYVPLAINLAVESGMRLQEIFNLTWEDVDVEKRRIEIRKSKTDHVTEYQGRTIVMTVGASVFAERLPVQIELVTGAFSAKPSDRVFPMTKDAFKQSWADVKARAKITDLTFHDLRHEAGSRFDEAELTKAENELMMGHSGRDTNSGYIHADLNRIQDKLDRHVLAGRTLREAEASVKLIVHS